MKNKFWFTVVMCCCSWGLFSQIKYENLTKEDYLKDFDFFIEVIKKQHPNPFRFITEKAFDKQTKQLREKLAQKPTIENFVFCNPLALIRDAHASIALDDLSFTELCNERSFFPFSTRVFSNRVFVNQFSTQIPIGAEIIRVNGMTVKEILDQIPNSVDGNVQSSSHINFTLYTSILFFEAKNYVLEYKDGVSSGIKTINLAPISYIQYNYNTSKTVLPQNMLSYSEGINGYLLNEDTYVLDIKTFNLSESYAYFKLETIFRKIKEKNIKKLIIDIRDNGGGSLSNIPLYYSFISKEKTFRNLYKYATRVLDIQVKDNLLDENEKFATGTDIKNLDLFMQQRFDKSEKDGFYYGNNRLDEYYVEHYPQDKNAFDGSIALLIDNNTISAATYFAHLFELNDRGIIVGQETRSCKNFTTAAWFLNYKLPHTETIVSLPRSEVFFNTTANKSSDCRGVLPQYSITADQYQKGLKELRDAELEFALAKIGE